MSEFYGSSDEAENLKVLQHAIDIGCTFWDTAGKWTKEVMSFGVNLP
jgi:aryl-alcohol dehydrogenase-like predicted oxidoreductase